MKVIAEITLDEKTGMHTALIKDHKDEETGLVGDKEISTSKSDTKVAKALANYLKGQGK